MAATCPPQVAWTVVRKNSRFLVKRDGARFAWEPRNASGKHSYSSSGLVHERAVGAELVGADESESGKATIEVQTVPRGKANKPAEVATETFDAAGDGKELVRGVNAATYETFYRPDMRAHMLRRVYRLTDQVKRAGKNDTGGRRARHSVRRGRVIPPFATLHAKGAAVAE